MKKIFSFLLFLLSTYAFAQTTISTPTVSGTWTLSGSPYLVQTSITVPANQVLTIQPGVVVKFIPETNFSVIGQLIANGAVSQPIVFEAADTTNWYDQNVTAGGWRGLHFKLYSDPVTDQSVLNHCVLRDVKYGYNYSVLYSNALTSERGLKILNSTIEHNHSGTNLYTAFPPISITTYSPLDTIEINNCIITDNTAASAIIQSSNSQGGCTRIIQSEIHHNHFGSCISASWNNLLIEGNDIHHNNTTFGTIRTSIGKTIIRGNKVHHNDNYDLAAVGCTSGRVTIENNLICNNTQNNPSCGMTGGGGGIHLSFNEFPGNSTFDSTYYIVRNNVIANNYSAFGGGGIYVFTAKTTISNNHLINNFGLGFGRAVLVVNPASEVYMKNNLFYSESTSGVIDTVQMVHVLSANKIQLDYNYLPSGYHKSLQFSSPFTLVGDTIHNVIGTNPGMIAPTPDNSYLTSALAANFGLLPSSPCLEEGDTAGVFPSGIDYPGNDRIVGIIDIGAYEYAGKLQGMDNNHSNADLITVYPNPVFTNGNFTILTPEPKGLLMIRDLTGRIILETELTTDKNTISLPPVSRGIYMVSFYGKKNATCKLVVNE